MGQLNFDERDMAMIKTSQNLDIAGGLWFARELERVKAKTYDTKYPELSATRIIPVDTSAGPATETITYHQYTEVGFAKIISNYADDLPRVDLVGEEKTSKVKSIGDSYGYNIQEIRAGQATGKPLQQRKANAARRAAEQEINRIAYFGDEKTGLIGLFTHPNITVYVLPADGTDSSTKFKDKTPDQILRDLNGMVNSVVTLTKGVEVPDTLLMSHAVYSDLDSRPRSSESDTTILEFFKKKNMYIKTIEVIPECEGAGTDGRDIIMAYKKDPDKLTLEIPQPFEQFPVQPKNLEFTVSCHARCGGVIIYYPLSIIKAEGC